MGIRFHPRVCPSGTAALHVCAALACGGKTHTGTGKILCKSCQADIELFQKPETLP